MTTGLFEERARRGIVRVLYSPRERFRSVVLEPGEERSFGRDERADVAVADGEMAGEHFRVFFDGVGFLVRARGQAALALDGRPMPFGQLASGGVVSAGRTTFRVFLERRTAAETTSPTSHADDVLAELGPARAKEHLYGVFDAARDPRVLVLLHEAIDEHASLYEGTDGAPLDDVAPYLVRFAPDSRLLERLVDEGWGHGWGIFAKSTLSPRDVRRHFRRFLMVLDEESDERMYFRFYDPRVLRDFYGIATPRQREELLQAMDEIVLEAEDGAVLRLAGSPAGRAI